MSPSSGAPLWVAHLALALALAQSFLLTVAQTTRAEEARPPVLLSVYSDYV